MSNAADWQMRRIESTSENPCCALVREMGEYRATVYFVPETQTWSFDIMHGKQLLHRRDGLSLLTALSTAGAAINIAWRDSRRPLDSPT